MLASAQPKGCVKDWYFKLAGLLGCTWPPCKKGLDALIVGNKAILDLVQWGIRNHKT